jgi:hypothetical protein
MNMKKKGRCFGGVKELLAGVEERGRASVPMGRGGEEWQRWTVERGAVRWS